MNEELNKLIIEFVHERKDLVFGTILFAALYSILEYVVVPRIIADSFENIQDTEKLKHQFIYLVATWIIIKIIYTISNYLRKNIEPEISQFITIKLLRSIFRKYEEESEIGNVAIILNKIF